MCTFRYCHTVRSQPELVQRILTIIAGRISEAVPIVLEKDLDHEIMNMHCVIDIDFLYLDFTRGSCVRYLINRI